MKVFRFIFLFILSSAMVTTYTFSHCQIPCGIYDDKARVEMIEEDILTIEKSMKSIIELSGQKGVDYNQLVRWIMNKENHADHIKEVVAEYFLAQRIKTVENKGSAAYKKYIEELTLLHEMIVNAMKAKQTTDLIYVTKLRNLLNRFESSYFDDVASCCGKSRR